MAFHQEDFAPLGTGAPDESLALEPKCHSGSSTVAIYDLTHHLVMIACSVCRLSVVDIAVARRPASFTGSSPVAAPAGAPGASPRAEAGASDTAPRAPTTNQRMDAAARRNRARKRK